MVVLEAKGQAGGRCIVDTVNFGMPMDLGAHWIHAPSDNPVVPLARAAGFTLYDDPDRPRLMIKGRSRARRVGDLRPALVPGQRAILEAGEAGREVPLSAAMPTNLRDWAATIDFLKGAWDSGKETSRSPASISTTPSRPATCSAGRATARSSPNWQGLPIRLSTPVTTVDWSGRGVAVETPAGTLRARAAIITVSTSVLASGSIRFTPALPKRQAVAVAALSCGTYEHLIVRLPAIRSTPSPTSPSCVKADTAATAKRSPASAGPTVVSRHRRALRARSRRRGETAMKAFAAEFIGNEFGRRRAGRWATSVSRPGPPIRSSAAPGRWQVPARRRSGCALQSPSASAC